MSKKKAVAEEAANYDYTAHLPQDEAAQQGSLKELTELAQKMALAESKVHACAADLERAQKEYKDIEERQLPEAMEKLGMTFFKTSTGLVIEVKENIRASITQDKRGKAFQWLRGHGHGGLIKRVLSVEFGMGQDEVADKLARDLGERSLDFNDKESVHPSTLNSFVSERLREGEDIPLDVFTVFRQNIAKLTLPK